ncbi:hypothetical protein SAMN05216266_103227 [Amycolatopsis marina]|uniref:Uncharacterized protein n=2 Tax=Amycolatopsis marina TaxID=490629 RepID=A0A1I0XI10_9PSEU|nr:hypothetical protein SAMN05216266_103227 [Amycolatopsis marina]
MESRLESGWAALSRRPDVQQQFRAHLAAVTDAVRCEDELVPRPEPVTPLVLLASHGYEVFQEADRRGWKPPEHEAQWTPGEWYGLRLLACYWLASEVRRGPPMPPIITLADPGEQPTPLGRGLPPPTEGEGRRRQA